LVIPGVQRRPPPEFRFRLEGHLRWVRDRASFWRERHAELTGLHLDAEFQLLSFLSDHPGRHFPAGLLVARAWPDSDLCEEQLRTYLVRLRRKLEAAGAPCRIVARRPNGYVPLAEDRPDLSASAAS
jgi:DNA-binding response OmpR family regulator